MKTMKIIKTLASIAVLTIASNSAWAAGTAAGTDIDNTAVINYSVGGTPQTLIESSEGGNSTPGATNGTPTTFKVDKKIDVLVTTGTDVNAIPGETNKAITFTVLNEGNSPESFNLVPSQVASPTDDFDTTGCTVTSPASSPVLLAADESVTVTVQCDIPVAGGVVVNGADSFVDLEASINGVAQTSGADTAGGVEVVFADDTGSTTDGADRNGSHSATNTYLINTASIIVGKTSTVISDPFNGTAVDGIAGTPKRIPGATVQYSITVSNASGAATATGIVISDVIPSTLTIVGTPTISGGTSTLAAASGQTVTSTAFNLAAGETATLLVTATIN